ncbi:TIR domain-containing protein [uncultured Ruminococcus sp.]|uniref:TIR domain-containing protein n=1 Tax=uncultured Ruminococcus sp. TaxID=165186 RepID=UPI00292CC86F|nr:TIR domain-containing protein [uncultured Ruminococcus sp.]
MAILKCKMCGGELNIQDGMTVAECEYCGTTQTLPKLVSDDIANLYDRANHFRRNNDFDKAEGIYERILSQAPEDAEAYWSLVLCRYGIEYVEDPATHKRVPTVNRAQYTAIFDDENYKSAIEHADAVQRRVYEEEAAAINEIQKGILAISQKEEPFDVFICYKESDNNGRRTPDSVLATDLYHQLTNEGFKVFFSRITLEDKLGTAYEPYIFAALNSAKVMVVLGTKPEYFNAVWVKNEWSRYLALVKQSGGKKVLIPSYRDMDPYDLPEEFSHLQAQDMSKLGFMQDLIRGIKKITKADVSKTQPKAQTAVASTASNDIAPLLERMFMYLEDGEWDKANEYSERVLDKDPENAEAYLGKLMADMNITNREKLISCKNPDGITSNNNYKKVIRFGDETLISELNGYVESIKEWRESVGEMDVESQIVSLMEDGEPRTIQDIMSACPGLKDASYETASQFVNELNEQGLFETFHSKRRRYYRFKGYEVLEAIKAAEKEEQIKAQERAKEFAQNREKIQLIRSRLEPIKGRIAVGFSETYMIQLDGSLWKTKGIYSEDLSAYQNIKIVTADSTNMICIRQDGTLLGGINNDEVDRIISSWRGVIDVAVGSYHVIGLKADGSVISVLEKLDMEYASLNVGQADTDSWYNIESVYASDDVSVGLRKDSTVVFAGNKNYDVHLCQSWKDIIEIGIGDSHIVGLKADGTVVAVGDEGYEENSRCAVSLWTDVVSIAAGSYHTVGLKADGTVLATGENDEGQCNVGTWKNVVAIAAGYNNTVGVLADGTLVATGNNEYGQCNVQGVRMFYSLESFKEDEKKAIEETEKKREEQIAVLNTEKNTLQTELANLKGLFTGKRRKEIEARLAQIESELNKL